MYFLIGFILVIWIILPGIKRVLFWRGVIFCFPVTLSVCFSSLASATTSYISSWYRCSHNSNRILVNSHPILIIIHLFIISIKIFNEIVIFIDDHFSSREHSPFLFQIPSAAAKQIEKAIQKNTILQCKDHVVTNTYLVISLTDFWNICCLNAVQDLLAKSFKALCP